MFVRQPQPPSPGCKCEGEEKYLTNWCLWLQFRLAPDLQIGMTEYKINWMDTLECCKNVSSTMGLHCKVSIWYILHLSYNCTVAQGVIQYLSFLMALEITIKFP